MSRKVQLPPTSPLRIAILGAGAIGSAFAFQFADVGGHEVTAIARSGSPRLQQLLRDQGVVKSTGERVAIQVTDTLDQQIAFDLIIVTLLAHQVQPILSALERSAAKAIQFMFNTFEPEGLQEAVGAGRCSFGMPFIQASLDREGHLDVKIGAAGQKSRMNSRESVGIFNQAGLPAVFEPKMLLWLRCHAPLGAAFESVSVAGTRRNGGASWAEAVTIARGLRESFTLIRRLGYPLYPSGKALLHASPVPLCAGVLWFMSRIRSFRDLLATGVNECRALVDVLVATAPRAHPPVSAGKILAMKP